MPLSAPDLDQRKFQDLVREVRARIPVHTPEYTNFNSSDPGQTLIDVFAFLSETLLYRLNRYPEGARRKFLQLLGMPLAEATSARGLVAFSNDRGHLLPTTLDAAAEIRAGQIPFQVLRGLDVLPVTPLMIYKQPVTGATDDVKALYRQLYASFRGQPPAADVALYTSVVFDPPKSAPVDLSQAAGNCLWIALLARTKELVDVTRGAIGGKTLSIGIVPSLTDAQRRLAPAGQVGTARGDLLTVEAPRLPASGRLPTNPAQRVPQYQPLAVSASGDPLAEPAVLDVILPPAPELKLWPDLDPLESGVGDFPPAMEDTAAADLIITWLRVRLARGSQATLFYVGINAALVEQREHVFNELLASGTGEPDQAVQLSNAPVLSATVKLTITPPGGKPEVWERIDDLSAAGPEVPVRDTRVAPGTQPPPASPSKVYAVDAESGSIQFGDGLRGARPPQGAIVRAEYDFSSGRAGNVGAGAISTGASLPGGVKVSNPIPAWGGADSETVEQGEKQIPRYLQHRDRLVTAEDFETITLRTPGVLIGRVEVVPTYNPQLAGSEPGDAAGAITLMLIPRNDSEQPDAPRPDRLFLDTICRYLNPRRLVTTELFLRGPTYIDVWVSVGVKVAPGASSAVVREAISAALRSFLAPLPAEGVATLPDQPPVVLTQPQSVNPAKGWPLRKSVLRLELEAVVARVTGVELVRGLLLAKGSAGATDLVDISGLQLPRLRGVSVVDGDPVSLEDLRGDTSGTGPGGAVSVPFVPEECH